LPEKDTDPKAFSYTSEGEKDFPGQNKIGDGWAREKREKKLSGSLPKKENHSAGVEEGSVLGRQKGGEPAVLCREKEKMFVDSGAGSPKKVSQEVMKEKESGDSVSFPPEGADKGR